MAALLCILFVGGAYSLMCLGNWGRGLVVHKIICHHTLLIVARPIL